MPNKTYGDLKNRIFSLVGEYTCSGECLSTSNNSQEVAIRMPGEINAALVRMYTSLPMSCDKPVIDSQTQDETQLFFDDAEFEALCNLSAAFLCREDEAETYTRLIYNYSDLSEGIYNKNKSVGCRRDFFYSGTGGVKQ